MMLNRLPLIALLLVPACASDEDAQVSTAEQALTNAYDLTSVNAAIASFTITDATGKICRCTLGTVWTRTADPGFQLPAAGQRASVVIPDRRSLATDVNAAVQAEAAAFVGANVYAVGGAGLAFSPAAAGEAVARMLYAPECLGLAVDQVTRFVTEGEGGPIAAAAAAYARRALRVELMFQIAILYHVPDAMRKGVPHINYAASFDRSLSVNSRYRDSWDVGANRDYVFTDPAGYDFNGLRAHGSIPPTELPGLVDQAISAPEARDGNWDGTMDSAGNTASVPQAKGSSAAADGLLTEPVSASQSVVPAANACDLAGPNRFTATAGAGGAMGVSASPFAGGPAGTVSTVSLPLGGGGWVQVQQLVIHEPGILNGCDIDGIYLKVFDSAGVEKCGCGGAYWDGPTGTRLGYQGDGSCASASKKLQRVLESCYDPTTYDLGGCLCRQPNAPACGTAPGGACHQCLGNRARGHTEGTGACTLESTGWYWASAQDRTDTWTLFRDRKALNPNGQAMKDYLVANGCTPANSHCNGHSLGGWDCLRLFTLGYVDHVTISGMAKDSLQELTAYAFASDANLARVVTGVRAFRGRTDPFAWVSLTDIKRVVLDALVKRAITLIAGGTISAAVTALSTILDFAIDLYHDYLLTTAGVVTDVNTESAAGAEPTCSSTDLICPHYHERYCAHAPVTCFESCTTDCACTP